MINSKYLRATSESPKYQGMENLPSSSMDSKGLNSYSQLSEITHFLLI
jgi:hypothetical protein